VSTFTGPSGETLTSNGSAAGDGFVAAYAKACADMARESREWHAMLAKRGVLVTSPDDGWVNRQTNTWVPPSYAHMGGPISLGTVVALGIPGAYRLVRITEVTMSVFGCDRYGFEEVRP
jgi:hypothetical protein